MATSSIAVKKINSCRLCASKSLIKLIDFGKVPLGNNLQKSSLKAKKATKYKLQVFRCSACAHFQLGHAVSAELLFATNYTYLSGIGLSFIKHIKKYVRWLEIHCNLKKKSFILDIGSNDGSCLNEFKLRGHKICGIDPAKIPSKIANESGIYTINNFFNKSTSVKIINKFGKADLITSQNVLAHVSDLSLTFKNVKLTLKDNGFFCFEVGYFVNVLEQGCFDTIYHEHLDYHHAFPLVNHLTKIGFSIVAITTNESQGGSLRILSKNDGKGLVSSQAKQFLLFEKKSKVLQKKYLADWSKKIDLSMKILSSHIEKFGKNLTIIGYGAPTKATLLLKMAKLNSNKISFIVEDNFLKINKFLPGNGIQIKDTKSIKLNTPDLIILLAWNFAGDLLKKLKKLKIKSTVIIPLPSLKIIKL